MVTLAQRITSLRTEKNLSRPALAAALGLPRTAIEKFETGRQTPTQEQQAKLAAYFGVSLFYLRGESDDPTSMDSWLGREAPEPERPAPRAAVRPAPAQSSSGGGESVFAAMLKSESFQALVRQSVLEVLRSPEGQALLTQAASKAAKC